MINGGTYGCLDGYTLADTLVLSFLQGVVVRSNLAAGEPNTSAFFVLLFFLWSFLSTALDSDKLLRPGQSTA